MPDRSHRLTIVGLGATGQSLGLALRRALPDVEIVGHDREPDASRAATKAGAVSRTHWNLISACDRAALVVLALPVRECLATLVALRNELAPGTVVTDTAPLKAPLTRWATEHLPAGVHFVGGHPLAPVGGPDASAFDRSTYCLTPSPDTDSEAVASVSRIVEAIGAQPAYLDPEEHDGLMWGLAGVSALAASVSLARLADAPGQVDTTWLSQAVPEDALHQADLGERLLAGVAGEADWDTAKRVLIRMRDSLDELMRLMDDDPTAGVSIADELRRQRDKAVSSRRESGAAGADTSPVAGRSSWRRMFGMR